MRKGKTGKLKLVIIGLIGLLALAAAALVLNKPKITPEQSLANAQLHYQNRNYSVAIIEAKNVLQKDRTNLAARRILGRTYLEQNKGSAAEKELEIALRIEQSDPQTQLLLARALLIQRKSAKVNELLNGLTFSEPSEEAKRLTLVAQAQILKQDYSSAELILKRALDVKNDFPEAHFGLIQLAILSNNKTKALKLAKELEPSYPDEPTFLSLYGDAWMLSGNSNNAIDYYGRALKQKPGLYLARLNRTKLLTSNQSHDKALEDIAYFESHIPEHPFTNIAKGTLLLSKQKWLDAQLEFEKALEKAPNFSDALLPLAVAHLQQNNLQQAEKYLVELIAAKPENQGGSTEKPHFFLAQIYVKKGKLRAAEEQIKKITEQYGSKPAYIALMGQIQMAKGDSNQARATLSDLQKLEPTSSRTHSLIGLNELASNNTDQAIAAMQKALELEPNNFVAAITLIHSKLRSNQLDLAITDALTLYKQHPKRTPVLNAIALGYKLKKDTTLAKKYFNLALSINEKDIIAASSLAEIAHQEGDVTTATELLRKLINHYPSQLRPRLQLAGLSYEIGDLTNALAILSETITALPNALQPKLLKAALQLEAGKHQAAIESILALSQEESKHPAALLIGGKASLALKRYKNAQRYLKKLIRTAPTEEAYLTLASIYSRQRNHPAAIDVLSDALTNKIKTERLHYNLAQAQLADNRPKDAQKTLHQLKKSGINSIELTYLNALLMRAQNKYGQSATALADIHKQVNNEQTAMQLTLAYRLNKQLKKAEKTAKNYLKNTPNASNLRKLYASILLGSDQKPKAIEQYEVLVKQDSRDFVSLNNLAYMYTKDNPLKAHDYAYRAHQLQPENTVILDTFGWILFQSGQTEKAVVVLEKAYKKGYSHPDISYHYAKTLSESGQEKRALAVLKRMSDDKLFVKQPDAVVLYQQLKKAKR